MQELEYYLPLTPDCWGDCDLCGHIGCRNDSSRGHEEFLRALGRAKSAGFQSILFSFHFLQWEHRDWALVELAARQLKARLRVRPQDAFIAELQALRQQGVSFEWIIDARQPSSLRSPLFVQMSDSEKDRFTLVVLKNHQTDKSLNALPAPIREKLRFYFPIPVGDEHLSPFEIYKLGEIVRYRFPQTRFSPPETYDIWEPRAPPDFGFEATIPLSIDRARSEKPLISVVIPTYNNRDYLLATLDHLVAQRLAPEEFEVTVVDDGSSDATYESVVQWLKDQPLSLNFRLLLFPRKTERQMGDGLYRAGVARNLGAKYCRGEYIAFLDSDILTPPHYLQDLLQRHRHADVIQSVRLNLKESVSSRSTRYEEIDPYRHTEPFEGNYWLDFFSEPRWSDLPFYWKYTCTYGLSLARSVFEKIGRIRRTFIYYGFEDTDLGYRLATSGYRFEISDAVTYHLFHTAARSEYRNSAQERHKVLRKTATVFYINQLDQKIFRHFHGFLGDPA